MDRLSLFSTQKPSARALVGRIAVIALVLFVVSAVRDDPQPGVFLLAGAFLACELVWRAGARGVRTLRGRVSTP